MSYDDIKYCNINISYQFYHGFPVGFSIGFTNDPAIFNHGTVPGSSVVSQRLRRSSNWEVGAIPLECAGARVGDQKAVACWCGAPGRANKNENSGAWGVQTCNLHGTFFKHGQALAFVSRSKL